MSRPDTSFDTAHRLLSRLARRAFFGRSGLWRFAMWGAMVGGGFFVAVGWALDALSGQPSDENFMAKALLGAYTLGVLRYAMHGCSLSKYNSVLSMQSIARSDYTLILGHGLSLFWVVFFGATWAHFVVCEVLWLLVWWGRAYVLLKFSKKPFVFARLCVGKLQNCDEQAMILDLVSSMWWESISKAERKELWNALSDWKWNLHKCSENTEAQKRISEWMEQEEHPYWQVVRGMYQDDLAKSIRMFRAALDGRHDVASYEFSFD